MSWLQAIRGIIRAYILNGQTEAVVTDIVTNGLTAADEAIVDAYLALNVPAGLSDG